MHPACSIKWQAAVERDPLLVRMYCVFSVRRSSSIIAVVVLSYFDRSLIVFVVVELVVLPGLSSFFPPAQYGVQQRCRRDSAVYDE